MRGDTPGSHNVLYRNDCHGGFTDVSAPAGILKDAGFVPPEVVWFHERARLRALLEAETDADARLELRRQLSELEQKIALRLESLRSHASL